MFFLFIALDINELSNRYCDGTLEALPDLSLECPIPVSLNDAGAENDDGASLEGFNFGLSRSASDKRHREFSASGVHRSEAVSRAVHRARD